MCNFLNGDESPLGFIVDTPAIRKLIDQTHRLMTEIPDDAERVERLRPAFADLLATDGWLPPAYAEPDQTSGMGGGIGQYALYRAENGSLCLFSLVIPSGATTPIHDHLAWGLVGVYSGHQAEIVYRRADDGSEEDRAVLETEAELTAGPGEFYTLLPPAGDIHEVTTISDEPSVSIHLLGNDTACVRRHQFDRDAQRVSPSVPAIATLPVHPKPKRSRQRKRSKRGDVPLRPGRSMSS